MSGNFNVQLYRPFMYQSRGTYNGVVQYDTGWIKWTDSRVSSDVASSTLVKTPGFKRLKGIKPIQPYSTIRTKIDTPLYTFGRNVFGSSFNGITWDVSYQTHRANATILDYGGDLTTPVMPLIEDPLPYARRKLLAKLSTAKASTAVSLGEFPKTVASVAKTATKVANALRALRTFNIDGLAKALEIKVSTAQRVRMGRKKREFQLNPGPSDILSASRNARYSDRYKAEYGSRFRTKDFFGDLWLEYSYGWKPLLNDVYQHAEALAEQFVEHQHVVLHAMASHATEGERYINYEPLSNDNYRTRRSKVQKWGRVGVRYSNENVSFANRFGLLNPFQVAWELVPFSFVVDWFLPIGNAIESLSATDGLTFHSGYEAYRTRVVNRCVVASMPPYGPPNGRYTPYGGGIGELTEITFSRSKMTSFPAPSFPGFKDPRSLAHGASAIALLNSLFLSKK